MDRIESRGGSSKKTRARNAETAFIFCRKKKFEFLGGEGGWPGE